MLTSCFQIFGPAATISCLAASYPAPGVQRRRKQNRFGSLHCALLLILLFEVLLFGFLITQSLLTSLLSSFFRFFLACGQASFALRRLPPAPGGTNPVRKKSMLAYFMTSPGSNHAITLPEQPAQQHSQQQVLVHAQQLAAAASSSNYQPALLPQHKAPRSATASRQRRCTVCRCSV